MNIIQTSAVTALFSVLPTQLTALSADFRVQLHFGIPWTTTHIFEEMEVVSVQFPCPVDRFAGTSRFTRLLSLWREYVCLSPCSSGWGCPVKRQSPPLWRCPGMPSLRCSRHRSGLHWWPVRHGCGTSPWKSVSRKTDTVDGSFYIPGLHPLQSGLPLR